MACISEGVPPIRDEQGGAQADFGPAHQLCAQLFDCLDVDRSETLEPAEIRRYLQMSGTPEDELDYYLKDVMRVADANQDGNVDKVEFLTYVLGDVELEEDGSFSDPEEELHMRAVVARALEVA